MGQSQSIGTKSSDYYISKVGNTGPRVFVRGVCPPQGGCERMIRLSQGFGKRMVSIPGGLGCPSQGDCEGIMSIPGGLGCLS